MTIFGYDDEVDTNANVSGQAQSPYSSDSEIDSDEDETSVDAHSRDQNSNVPLPPRSSAYTFAARGAYYEKDSPFVDNEAYGPASPSTQKRRLEQWQSSSSLGKRTTALRFSIDAEAAQRPVPPTASYGLPAHQVPSEHHYPTTPGRSHGYPTTPGCPTTPGGTHAYSTTPGGTHVYLATPGGANGYSIIPGHGHGYPTIFGGTLTHPPTHGHGYAYNTTHGYPDHQVSSAVFYSHPNMSFQPNHQCSAAGDVPSISVATTSSLEHTSSSSISGSLRHEQVSNSEEPYEEEDANDPERREAEKRLEIEDTISSPEWRKLYLSVPLGRLPNAAICRELAPPGLQILATVPFTEILYKPRKATAASMSSDPASMPSGAVSAPSDATPAPSATTSFQPVPSFKKPSSEKQTLRTNSTNLFCYQKVGHKYVCKLPIVVDGVERPCDIKRTAGYGGSSLKKHLLAKHPGVLDAIEYFRKQQKLARDRLPRDQQHTPNGTKRQNISSTTGNGAPWTGQQQYSAEHLLMKLVAVEGLSFKSATSVTLKALCRLLNPKFSFPDHVTLQERLRKAVNDKKERAISYIHANVVRGAITADAWTSTHNKRKYLSVTFHYMTQDFQLSSMVIGMERILVPKVDAEVLTSIIDNVVAKWSLQGKVIGLTSDQGSNIKKCLRDYEEKSGAYWIPCSAHKIQGCINKAWDKTDAIVKITKKCTWISNFFNNNSVARDIINKKWRAHIKNNDNPLPGNGASLGTCPLFDNDPPSDNHTSLDNNPPLSNGQPVVNGVPLGDGNTVVNIPPSSNGNPVGNIPSSSNSNDASLAIRSTYMQEEVAFLTGNVTRWNSKFNVVSRVLDVVAVLKPTAQDLLKLKTTTAEMTKFLEFEKNLISDDEVDVLSEVVILLRPAADFTHWVGGSGYSTISQVYAKAYGVLPAEDTIKTGPGILLYKELKSLIHDAWPKDNISDGMLLAMYFNPGCATFDIWGKPNAHQAAEMDAEQAARRAIAEAAKSAAVEADEYDYLQDPDPEQFTGPHQIPIKVGRSPPAPTNRLRAETLVFRAMIQLNAEKAMAQRREAGASNPSLSSAQDAVALDYWKLDAQCNLRAYREVWLQGKVDSGCFDDPVAFWKSKESLASFAVMATLARMYLIIQATSSESERLFSKAGLVYSARRSRLSDNNFCNVIFFNSLEKTLCQAYSR